MSPARSGERVEFLDGLRACAIVPVVFFHVWLHSNTLRGVPTWKLASLGMHGVELFFVISGFCLSYPVLKRAFYTGTIAAFDYRTFLARRLVRIFPPFWCALLLLIFVSWTPIWPILATDASGIALHSSLSDTVREAILFDGQALHNGSFWSLAVELRWYFLFPLALWLFMRSPRLAALLCIALWTLYAFARLQVTDIEVLPAFLMGIFAADAFIRRPAWLHYAPHALLAAVVLTLLFPSRYLFDHGPLWQLVPLLFVLTTLRLKWLQNVLSWKPLVAIGLASYSIYLVHEPLVVYLDELGASPWLVAVAAFAAGGLFWLLIERTLLLSGPRRRMIVAASAAIDFVCSWRPSAASDGAPSRVRATGDVVA